MKHLSILILSCVVLFSCGKDNKTNTPASTPVVDIQDLGTANILNPFDPSFENVDSTTNNRRLPNLYSRYFRIKGRRNGNRNRVQAQIVNGVSFSGDRALQLFDAQNQTLIFPLDTDRKVRPLNLIPGARYRISAKVRLPGQILRGNFNRTFEASFTVVHFSENDMLGRESFQRGYQWPNDGEWTEISQEFEMPSLTQKGQFQLKFNGSSDVIVDDLILLRIR